jgi:hypothetical protein
MEVSYAMADMVSVGLPLGNTRWRNVREFLVREWRVVTAPCLCFTAAPARQASSQGEMQRIAQGPAATSGASDAVAAFQFRAPGVSAANLGAARRACPERTIK